MRKAINLLIFSFVVLVICKSLQTTNQSTKDFKSSDQAIVIAKTQMEFSCESVRTMQGGWKHGKKPIPV